MISRCRTAALVVAAAMLLAAGPALAQTPVADPLGCTAAPGDPAPGSPEWYARELREARCGEQRVQDTASNPLFAAAGAENVARDGGAVYEGDPFRDPSALSGHRLRY